MPFIEGQYISEVPNDPYANRFSLAEADALAPGVREKVLGLLVATDYVEYSQRQSDAIQALSGAGIAPKDVYISDEDRVGYTDIHKSVPLETYMIGVGLHKVANPFGSELLGRTGKIRSPYKRTKVKKRGPRSKTGMLWD